MVVSKVQPCQIGTKPPVCVKWTFMAGFSSLGGATSRNRSCENWVRLVVTYAWSRPVVRGQAAAKRSGLTFHMFTNIFVDSKTDRLSLPR